MRAQADAYKADLDRSQTLRTQAMRDMEKERRRKNYRFAIMRFRLPGGVILQGTFAVRERVQALREFVAAALASAFFFPSRTKNKGKNERRRKKKERKKERKKTKTKRGRGGGAKIFPNGKPSR